MGRHRKITWAPSAFEDLREAYEYIQADRPEAARRWLKEILSRVEKLAEFPKLGRLIPEIGQVRYRELLIGEFRIFHEVTEKEVHIFRVLHSKRLFRFEA